MAEAITTTATAGTATTIRPGMPFIEKPLLARLSVAMFGMVMGTGGLADAWAKAHEVFGVPLLVSQVLLGFAVLCFGVLVVAHLAKLGFCFAEVAEEFAHPVRSSFFPAISVAAIVLSVGLRRYSPVGAEVLWCLGAAMHFVFAITLIRRWILHPQDEGVLTPAWFIPVVGNILVPVGGVPLGFVEVSWFFFSVGLMLWLSFFTIVLHRVLFVPAMSQRSMPTLFILLAPPSIGLSAYLAFTGGHAGALGDILYCLALFIAVLLASLGRHMAHGPFFMSWWAMTFPVDGWAGASLAYAQARPGAWTTAVAVIALVAATLIVVWVGVRTAGHMASGAAFRED
ncbi:SLAC1 anion channel family protein [Xylophilus sp. GOD-11R]|uniref:SLAC1 anion channel family protein n=1 Tax=Xylophilus sp. GOD-11R TaxID=3089814 RepID=UPI00298CE677|nr:SLAC1 anion channel family protein [Xylophilus sp. GOD-11R]WPB56287.1 SLAC1 anion channel family protein [Xylophilus sp. GOD-11R]